MSASIILEYDCDEIQAAMAVALLRLKNAHKLTYKDIGKVIERELQSVQQYICSDTEMPASCWIKAVARWPELRIQSPRGRERLSRPPAIAEPHHAKVRGARGVKRPAKPSAGLTLARNLMVAMSDAELSALTSDRLIASYGVTLGEADQLIRNFRRV
jgi:hypothetical protein